MPAILGGGFIVHHKVKITGIISLAVLLDDVRLWLLHAQE